MKVPENIALNPSDWNALTDQGRAYVEALVSKSPAPYLRDAIAQASDAELEALPYIGPENKDNFRAWAKGEEVPAKAATKKKAAKKG